MDLDQIGPLLEGGDGAWDSFVARTRPLLLRAVASVLGSPREAEDIVQTVYSLLCRDDFRLLRSFQGRSRLSTWLVAIARRQALLGRRTESRRRDRENAQPLREAEDDPLLALEKGEDREAMRRARARLSARDQLLLVLACEDGRSAAEIAAILGLSTNSISPLVGRAKGRLRSELDRGRPEGGGEPPVPEFHAGGVRLSPPAATEGLEQEG